MLNTTLQTPNVQPQTLSLPDDSDRVTSVIGFNPNNYVFNNDVYTPQNQPAQNVQNQPINPANPQAPVKKNSSALGFVLLGALLGGAFCLLKGKGSFKLPDLTSVKDGFHNFINKFKKP